MQSPSPIRLNQQDTGLNVDGFVITETVRGPGTVLKPHFHEFTNIALVLDGAFIETIGSRSAQVGPASLIVRTAGEKHANAYDQPARSIIIEVTASKADLLREGLPVSDSALHLKSQQFAGFARSLHRELRSRDSAKAFTLESIVFDLMAQSSRLASFSGEPPAVRRALEILHAGISERQGLVRIADLIGVHPSTLARQFRRHQGCSMGEYLRRLRLDHAATEIVKQDRTLSDIALEAGFYDQSHFTNLFRKRFGQTPAEYRRSHRRLKIYPKTH